MGGALVDKDAPIELPADLSIARNELAVIRSQSLADERAAHAAEQRKNELVAYLAHDIRTPLTSVLGYLDLLRSSASDCERITASSLRAMDKSAGSSMGASLSASRRPTAPDSSSK